MLYYQVSLNHMIPFMPQTQAMMHAKCHAYDSWSRLVPSHYSIAPTSPSHVLLKISLIPMYNWCGLEDFQRFSPQDHSCREGNWTTLPVLAWTLAGKLLRFWPYIKVTLNSSFSMCFSLLLFLIWLNIKLFTFF